MYLKTLTLKNETISRERTNYSKPLKKVDTPQKPQNKYIVAIITKLIKLPTQQKAPGEAPEVLRRVRVEELRIWLGILRRWPADACRAAGSGFWDSGFGFRV